MLLEAVEDSRDLFVIITLELEFSIYRCWGTISINSIE